MWKCLMDFSWCPLYIFILSFYFIFLSFILFFSFYLTDSLTKGWEHRVVVFFLGISLPESLNQEGQRPCCKWKTRMMSCCVEKPKIKELRVWWHHTPLLRLHHFPVEGIGLGFVESTFFILFFLYCFLFILLLMMELADSRAFSDD